MTNVFDKVHILLCGYYFQGNTGDDIMMEAIVKSLSKYGEIKVTGSFNKDEIDWCDILLIGGGTHIRPWNMGGYEHAKYAREKGKRIVYYAQTIEDGHPLFEEHLSRADFITVRDSESKRVVERHGFRAILTSDPVLAKRRRMIGFSLRKWFTEPPGFTERFASVLDDLSKDYDIVSIPYTLNQTDTESDLSYHDKIIQLMKSKPTHFSYDEIIHRTDLLMGMRLHAIILAINMGKKVLAIDYDPKVGRILSDLDLKDMVVSYNDVERIPDIIRNKIFRVDSLAQREKINEALIGKLCADMKGERSPKISVVMYTRNRAECLTKAIDSIIEQTIQDWQLIIIDDGSTDDTEEQVQSYKDRRIKYYNFGYNGMGFSRNIGNLLSRGEIILVADSDCINLPNRLEVTCIEMEQNGADIIYSSMFYLNSDMEKKIMSGQPFSYEKLREHNFLYHPTVAYRIEVAMKCPYNENSEILEDYSMYLRASDMGYKFHYIKEPLVIHPLHDGQPISSKSSEILEVEKGIPTSYRFTSPVVSIIIPTCNRPKFLKEALESILSQTYKNFEIIVINDGGEDVSDMITSLNRNGKIIYLWHENSRGPSAARNTGLKAARGKYIAYLDDDDIYYPNHLETLVVFLARNNYKVAYTDSYQASQTWITDRYVTIDKKIKYNFDFDRQRFLVGNYIHIISIVHNKELLNEVGLFDEKLETHEDWDLCIRLSEKYDFYHIKAATAEFRMRDDMSSATSIKRADFLRTFKLIHKRYSHLVMDSNIFEEQRKAEEALTREVEIRQMSSSTMEYGPLHHYRFAKEFVKDKKVLVLGSDKGYGGFILSEDAESVRCIDKNEHNVREASSNYIKENLEFIKGSITDIPIKAEKSFDVIVCFEALELIEEHDELMKKAKRLLKDDGIFIVSWPNKYISSDQPDYQPPAHLKKLSFGEFKSLLKKNFKNTVIYGQKVYPSSNIFPLFKSSGTTRDYVIEKGDKAFLFVPHERKEAQYLLAVSSDGDIKDIPGNSYLVDVSEILFKLKDGQIRNLEIERREKDSYIMNLEGAIKEKDKYILGLEASVRDKENNLKDKYIHIGNLEAGIKEKDVYIVELENNLRENATTLHQIYGSHGWKVLLVYYKIRNRLLPANTKRRLFVKLIFNAVFNPKSFLKNLNKTNLKKFVFYLKSAEPAILEDKAKRSILKASSITPFEAPIFSEDIIEQLKSSLLAIGRVKVRTFIENHAFLEFPAYERPDISILMVTFNKVEYTFQCLESIKAHADIPYEVVIVDNASTDETGLLLSHVRNAKMIKNIINVGFLKACNQAASKAMGKYILFLNNDTQITPGMLANLVKAIKDDENIGAVCGRLIFPDGRLQEAGSIIWRDGSCLGYGRGDDPFKPKYSYVKEVYYGSGACLLTRRELFLKAGMFDETFSSAYYEDTDYCMWLRDKGYKVVYQPLGTIIHYEFGSSSNLDAIDLQIRNREKFLKKWEKALERFYPYSEDKIIYSREVFNKKRNILFIDDRIPLPALGSGYPRGFEVLNAFIKLGVRVTFFPLQFSERLQPLTTSLQQLGVEVFYGFNPEQKLNFEYFYKERKNYYDFVFVSRPHNMQEVRDIIRKNNPEQKIIYDAEALFSMREVLELEIAGKKISDKEKERMITDEINIARQADAVVAVSRKEAEVFKKYGIKKVFVLGLSIEISPTPKSFEERSGILFVGSFLSSPSPNEDAILHFVNKIYLRVYDATGAKLFIVGTNNVSAIWNLKSEHIEVTGRVPDIFEYYNSCRIFVVPTRYAAGIPLKLYEAASHGLPAVVTPLIGEQVEWVDGDSALIGYDENDFADKCIALYTKRLLWENVRLKAIERVKTECNRDYFVETIKTIMERNEGQT